MARKSHSTHPSARSKPAAAANRRPGRPVVPHSRGKRPEKPYPEPLTAGFVKDARVATTRTGIDVSSKRRRAARGQATQPRALRGSARVGAAFQEELGEAVTQAMRGKVVLVAVTGSFSPIIDNKIRSRPP